MRGKSKVDGHMKVNWLLSETGRSLKTYVGVFSSQNSDFV